MRSSSKEPAWPSAFKEGFLSMPTAGMRLAPQVLVLELMRELSYSSSGGATNTSDSKAMPLDPTMSEGPLAQAKLPAIVGLVALKGRAKERKAQSSFYAPAYPEYAAHGWMRRSSDRVIRDFFLRGALAAGVAGDKGLEESTLECTVRALYGRGQPQDVLHLCANTLPQPPELASPGDALSAASRLLSERPDWGVEEGDILSGRIARDWRALCLLEPFLPRLAWVELVGTFLRTVTPLWLLAQMRVCVIVRDFVRAALDGRNVDAAGVRGAICRRHESLLVPSITLTDSVDDAVVEYMRARVELKVVFAELAQLDEDLAQELQLPLSVANGKGKVGLDRLKEMLGGVADPQQFYATVVRKAETYPAWARPLKIGQGKNIEEFLRVMRNDHVGGQDDGYLLERGPRNRRLFRVFPAQKVIALFALLAHADKVLRLGSGQRLLLADLEKGFQEMGIDFTILGGVRVELLRALANAGVLSGTPDAGEGAELTNPYAAALNLLEKEGQQ